nr:hydrogenase maturation nickel metallochaperone HypA [Natronorubrum daqingense]
MPVTIQCDDCGLEHTIPDRPDQQGGGTGCPQCGGRSFTVRRDELEWHPRCAEG